MSTPLTLSAEWLAPGSVETVSAAIEKSLADQGGRVQGLDAEFGNALRMRLVGTLFPGTEDNLPFHLHVDIRPGTAPGEALVRVEFRSTEGFYLFQLQRVDAQYRERFDRVVSGLRSAAGDAAS